MNRRVGEDINGSDSNVSLQALLKHAEVACPLCGGRLSLGAGDRCPTCGCVFVVSVGSSLPRLGWWLAALIGVAIPLGFGARWIPVSGMILLKAGGASLFAAWPAYALIVLCVAGLIPLIRYRRVIWGLPPSRQRIVGLGVLFVMVVAFGLCVASWFTA